MTDYQLQSIVILSEAGYDVMAIKAVRLLTDPSEKTIRGSLLRDINIKMPQGYRLLSLKLKYNFIPVPVVRRSMTTKASLSSLNPNLSTRMFYRFCTAKA